MPSTASTMRHLHGHANFPRNAMKLQCILLLSVAAMLPAQAPSKPKPASNPAPAKPAAQAPGSHATLADLQRDFQTKKFAALEAYVKTHAAAKDADEAIVEAVGLAKTLGRHADTQRLAELYLKDHADGQAAGQMKLARAVAMADGGNAAGAEQALREVIAGAGDDINGLVGATLALAQLLVDTGKKDAAIELLNTTGEANAKHRGLKEHLAGFAESYALIGTEPKPIGADDTAGKAIDLAEYKGKVVLLDFWATWCGPCVAELPNVLAAYEKFHGHGFEIVGISLDQDRAKLDKFVADRGMTWRQQFDGKGWKNDVAVAWGVQSIPATYLIGPDGKIAAVGLRGEQLEQKLAKYYPAKAPAAPASAPKK